VTSEGDRTWHWWWRRGQQWMSRGDQQRGDQDLVVDTEVGGGQGTVSVSVGRDSRTGSVGDTGVEGEDGNDPSQLAAQTMRVHGEISESMEHIGWFEKACMWWLSRGARIRRRRRRRRRNAALRRRRQHGNLAQILQAASDNSIRESSSPLPSVTEEDQQTPIDRAVMWYGRTDRDRARAEVPPPRNWLEGALDRYGIGQPVREIRRDTEDPEHPLESATGRWRIVPARSVDVLDLLDIPVNIVFLLIALVRIFAPPIVLSQYWGAECSQPLKYWLLSYSVTTLLQFVFQRLSGDDTLDGHRRLVELSSVQKTFVFIFRLLSWVYCLLFILGLALVSLAGTRPTCHPVIYRVSLALVCLHGALLASGVLFFLSLCVFAPLLMNTDWTLSADGTIRRRSLNQDDRGATEWEINRIRMETFRTGMFEEIDITCPICLCEYEDGDKIRILPCASGHHFHADCIFRWLVVERTCAICRRDINVCDDIMRASSTMDEMTAVETTPESGRDQEPSTSSLGD